MNISKAAMNKSKCKKSLDYKNEYNKIDTWRADKKALQTTVSSIFLFDSCNFDMFYLLLY